MTATWGNQPRYKSSEHVLLLCVFRLGCVASSSPEGKGPSNRPVQQEITCSPFAKLLAGQPVTGSQKCQLHLFPFPGTQDPSLWGQTPPRPSLPCSALRKARFHLFRGSRRSQGWIFPEQSQGKTCQASFSSGWRVFLLQEILWFFQQRRGCSQWDNRELMRGKKCQDINNKMNCCDILRFPNLNDVGAGVKIVEIEILPIRNVFFAFSYAVSIILDNRSSWLHPNLW